MISKGEKKMKNSKNTKQQGWQLSVPCHLGDTIYCLEESASGQGMDIVPRIAQRLDIRPLQSFVITDDGKRYNFEQFGKTVFTELNEIEFA